MCIMARILGLFCMRIDQTSKHYFIIMQNLDFFPQQSVIFRYDLKFSEVNRQHVDAIADLQVINDLLMSKDETVREVLNFQKSPQSLNLFQVQLGEPNNQVQDDDEYFYTATVDERPSQMDQQRPHVDSFQMTRQPIPQPSLQYEGKLFNSLRGNSFLQPRKGQDSSENFKMSLETSGGGAFSGLPKTTMKKVDS